jgi:CRP/FNR family transcriptional regulator
MTGKPSQGAVENFLALSPFFNSVPAEDVQRLAAITRPMEFRKGATIFEEGEECRGFYLVRSGAVKVFRLSPEGKERVLFLAEPGQSFAEVAVFLGDGRYPATAQAARASEVLFLPKEEFVEMLARKRELCFQVLASLAQWTKHLVRFISSATQQRAEARLAKYLLDTSMPGKPFFLPTSKQVLASYLTMTPETFSRVLRRWRDRKILRVHGRKMEILNREALRREALEEASSRRAPAGRSRPANKRAFAT